MSGKINVDIPEEVVTNAVIKALQNNAHIAEVGMAPFTLKDTGALVHSSFIEDTETGFRINYGVDYAQYVYHNPRIKHVTTPGTSPYWDDKYEMSDAYDHFLSLVDRDVEELLSNV